MSCRGILLFKRFLFHAVPLKNLGVAKESYTNNAYFSNANIRNILLKEIINVNKMTNKKIKKGICRETPNFHYAKILCLNSFFITKFRKKIH